MNGLNSKKTWYAAEGSKLAEFWTILHIPYTLMSLSFLAIGFGISGVHRWDVFALVMIAYFLGLGIAAHALDQLPGQGSSYVKYLTKDDLIFTGLTALTCAVAIGIVLMEALGAWQLLWLIPLQTFFVFAYPLSKFANGLFHNDISFAFSFGFIPVMGGYYMNNLTITAEFIPWALVAVLISGIEITLSRYVRVRRQINNKVIEDYKKYNIIIPHPLELDIEREYRLYIMKPELALKLLCILSYLLAAIFLLR